MANYAQALRTFWECQAIFFEELICPVGSTIGKKNSNFRERISVIEYLALTMRFLATENSYHSLMYLPI